MVKDKMNIPQIRFKGFEGEWNNELLKNLLSFSNGVNAPKENYGKGRKMISVLDILNKGRLHYSNILNSVFVDNITEQKNKVVKGDLVFVRSSEIVEEVGLAKAYLDDDYALHSGFTICGTKISDFDSFFLELSLNSVNRKEVERKAGGSTRYNVSQTVLNDIHLFMPSQSEQTQIGDFFQKIDQVIELQQKALDTARAYKQSMLQKMFPQKGEKVPRVRFAGFSGDWESKKLKQLGVIVTGSTPTTNEADNYDDGGLMWITPSDITSLITTKSAKRLSVKGQKKARIVPPNTLLITCIASIGKNTLVLEKSSFNQQINALIPYEQYNAYFLLTHSYFWSEIMKNYAAAGMMQIVNKNDFSNLSFLFPEKEEQTVIGNFFQKLDQQIEQQAQKLATYQQLKKAMLQRMFV